MYVRVYLYVYDDRISVALGRWLLCVCISVFVFVCACLRVCACACVCARVHVCSRLWALHSVCECI